MSDSIKARLEAAARSEPAVGDPYARFLKRRRLSRSLRSLSAFVVAAVTMIGFIQIFPGGSGGLPDEGPIPAQPGQPPLEPFRLFAASDLGLRMLIPDAWEGVATPTGARVGPSLDDGPPERLEIWFGNTGTCADDNCSPVSEIIAQPARAREAGLRISDTSLPFGSVRVGVTKLLFPKDSSRLAPSCPGCVGLYAEIGRSALPMLVLAADAAELNDSMQLLEEMMRTVRVA